MPWRCPACRTHIRHAESTEHRPRPNVVYRCPVCHLELLFDEIGDKLTVVPFADASAEGTPPIDLFVDRRRRPR